MKKQYTGRSIHTSPELKLHFCSKSWKFKFCNFAKPSLSSQEILAQSQKCHLHYYSKRMRFVAAWWSSASWGTRRPGPRISFWFVWLYLYTETFWWTSLFLQGIAVESETCHFQYFTINFDVLLLGGALRAERYMGLGQGTFRPSLWIFMGKIRVTWFSSFCPRQIQRSLQKQLIGIHHKPKRYTGERKMSTQSSASEIVCASNCKNRCTVNFVGRPM